MGGHYLSDILNILAAVELLFNSDLVWALFI